MQGLQSLWEELTIRNAGIVKVHKRSSPSWWCRDLQSAQEKVLKVLDPSSLPWEENWICSQGLPWLRIEISKRTVVLDTPQLVYNASHGNFASSSLFINASTFFNLVSQDRHPVVGKMLLFCFLAAVTSSCCSSPSCSRSLLPWCLVHATTIITRIAAICWVSRAFLISCGTGRTPSSSVPTCGCRFLLIRGLGSILPNSSRRRRRSSSSPSLLFRFSSGALKPFLGNVG